MHMSVCISVCLSTHTLTTHFTIAYFDDMGLSPWIFIPHQLLSTVINGHQLSPLHTTSRHADISMDICHHCTPPLFCYFQECVLLSHFAASLIVTCVCVCVYFDASTSGAPLSCACVTSYSVSQCQVYSYIIDIYTYTYKMYISRSLSLSLSPFLSLTPYIHTYIYT